MTKAELMKNVGKKVEIIFADGNTTTGVLGFTKEFSSKYGYRKPNCFTVNNWDFKVSHVKKIKIF